MAGWPMSIASVNRIEVAELQRFASLIAETRESEIAADVTLGGRLLLAQHSYVRRMGRQLVNDFCPRRQTLEFPIAAARPRIRLR